MYRVKGVADWRANEREKESGLEDHVRQGNRGKQVEQGRGKKGGAVFKSINSLIRS